MADNTSNTKRIAKNTAVLYMRMLILMAVSLYTSRVILEALGISDFGIYNVVGGVVAMFSIISASISGAISRYLTIELGRKNHERLQLIFSTSINILILLSIAIIIVAEPLGTWFLNTKMEIPEGRLVAANWVFQFSIATFVVNLISIPYNAAIIAHEKMNAFAYISIAEALGKLSIAYCVLFDVFDKLIFYAFLMFLIALIVRMLYSSYCNRNFKECKYHFVFDKPLLKEMFGFASWNFIGTTSNIFRTQGGNVIINLFFGTVANAACGVANQVNHAITGFVNNFTTAINPQIMKSYASGDHEYMMKLIFKGAKLSFYMLLVLSLPIILNVSQILSMWLKAVPEYSAIFVQLTLVFALFESVSYPLIIAQLSTGNIRNYQIVVGGLQMLNLPFFYIFLKLGFPPQWVYIITIFFSFICLIARLIFLNKSINLSIKLFFYDVVLKVVIVSVVSYFPPMYFIEFIDGNFYGTLLRCIICFTWTSGVVYLLGLSHSERTMINAKLRSILNRLKR